jgi:hypothetical protein
VVATAGELVDRARGRAGLTDLGPDGWQDGLEHLLEGVGADVGGDPAGVASIEGLLVGRLVTRLEIEAWCAEQERKPPRRSRPHPC